MYTNYFYTFRYILEICEVGWEYHDGNCLLFHTSLTYENGVNFCNASNATLPITDTKPKDFFVGMLAGEDNTWIGYTDRNNESNWEWENGSNSTYVNWGFMKPDGGISENCAIIDTSTTRRAWDDTRCNTSNKVICEKGITFLFIFILFI